MPLIVLWRLLRSRRCPRALNPETADLFLVPTWPGRSKPRREAPPAPPPRPATWAEFAFPAEGDVLEFCELCVWLFECFVCMAGFANLQTFAIYPLYSTAFATALIKGVECFVIGKFAPPPAAPDAADERDASPPPRRRTLSSGSHGSPKRNRKGSR